MTAETVRTATSTGDTPTAGSSAGDTETVGASASDTETATGGTTGTVDTTTGIGADDPTGPDNPGAHGPRPSAAIDDPTALPSLSPSRAADFKTCPLLFRFRTIDKLPERPSLDQARGTLVHAVLERLFDLAPERRTLTAATAMVAPQWDRLVAEQPPLAELFPDQLAGLRGATGTAAGAGATTATTPLAIPASADAPPLVGVPVLPRQQPGAPARGDGSGKETEPLAAFLDSARALLHGYFAMEDPRRLAPAERESLISAVVDGQLLIRGYVDRLDVAPGGQLRVVDYKTGGAPREAFEARALFQLKFYALVLWRTRGVVPSVLRLLYLKDTEVCDYTPDADELNRFERTLLALWQAIERARASRDFRPKPSRLCDWCDHQALCPAYGGTPPPYPQDTAGPGQKPVSRGR